MAMASSPLQASVWPQIRRIRSYLMANPSTVSCKRSPVHAVCGCGAVSPSWLNSRSLHQPMQDCLLPAGVFRDQIDPLAAIGDMTAVPSNSHMQSQVPSEELKDESICNDGNVNEETDDGDEKADTDALDGQKMVRVCDKLIEVFMVDKPRTTDWRRLLAFSREWDKIRPHFYKRCLDRADAESDPDMKHKLFRLERKLKEIDEDVQRHDELLAVIKAVPSGTEISEIVARRRKDFTREFFEHLHAVAESYYDNPTYQNALAKLGNACLAAVQAYDTASESIEALNAADLKFKDILNSPSLDVACKKIDSLAEKKQLDSAFMLMITKAYSAAKESSMVKDEAKDILYHLYMTARGNLQRLMPKEIRIIKYLLTIEDPEERLSALKDAFTPGVELEGKDVDSLYTTPEKLFTWIQAVVDAYHFSREGTLIREAKDLMNPNIIKKLEGLQKLLQEKFM